MWSSPRPSPRTSRTSSDAGENPATTPICSQPSAQNLHRDTPGLRDRHELGREPDTRPACHAPTPASAPRSRPGPLAAARVQILTVLGSKISPRSRRGWADGWVSGSSRLCAGDRVLLDLNELSQPVIVDGSVSGSRRAGQSRFLDGPAEPLGCLLPLPPANGGCARGPQTRGQGRVACWVVSLSRLGIRRAPRRLRSCQLALRRSPRHTGP